MGFLNKLFGNKDQQTQPRNKADRRTELEKVVDNITPASMNEHVKTLADPMKVPYAQAMTILLFSRVFTRGLIEFFEELPEPFRTNWPFPHDRVFVEVASFYYFALLKDSRPEPPEADGHWNADEEDKELADGQSDPYCDDLNASLHLCSTLVHSFVDKTIHEHYIVNRANSYSPIHRGKNTGVVEKLAGHIMEVWNPNRDGRSVLDFSSPLGTLYALIAKMPVNDVIAACRELHEEKSRNPKAF